MVTYIKFLNNNPEKLRRLMEPWARAHGKRPWSSLGETSVRAHTPVGKRAAQTGGGPVATRV